MSPFLLWRSAACKQRDRRGGDGQMDGGLEGEACSLSLAAAHKEVPTEAVERCTRGFEHESDLAQEAPPISAREQAVVMPVVLDAHPTSSIANQNRKVDEIA